MNLSWRTRSAIEWRHAWPVRFAHHPLCARHRHETWRIGRMFVCRGCASLALGLAVGVGAVLLAPGAWVSWMTLALAVPVVVWSWPRTYPSLPRPVRDALRAALGLLIALASHTVFSAPAQWWPLLPLGVAVWWVYRGHRAAVQRGRCTGCPELGHGVCSGFAEHARIMRAIAATLEARLEVGGAQR